MGMSKLNQYSEKELELYEICKAIAHPARIRILNYLSEFGDLRVRDLEELLELSRSTINIHLSKLKQEGFIESDFKNGVCYVFLTKPNTINELNLQIESWHKTTSIIPTRKERRNNLRLKTKTKGQVSNLNSV